MTACVIRRDPDGFRNPGEGGYYGHIRHQIFLASWKHWRIWRHVTIVAGKLNLVHIFLQGQRAKSANFDDEVAIANPSPSAPIIERLWIGLGHWWIQSDLLRLTDHVDVHLYRQA
jgi:hypothetical protein